MSERAPLYEASREVVDQWHRWRAYLKSAGIEPESRGIAPFVDAMTRLELLLGEIDAALSALDVLRGDLPASPAESPHGTGRP